MAYKVTDIALHKGSDSRGYDVLQNHFARSLSAPCVYLLLRLSEYSSADNNGANDFVSLRRHRHASYPHCKSATWFSTSPTRDGRVLRCECCPVSGLGNSWISSID